MKVKIDLQRRYEELFNSLPDGAFVIDTGGNLIMVNDVATALLGYKSQTELVGSTIDKVYANPSDHDALLSILGHKKIAKKNIFDWKKKNGDPLLIELTATPIHDEQGHICGIQGIFRDISRRLESQIAQQETLAEAAARSIDESKFLEAVDFYRSVPMSLILQGIAHNLNTPLGGIRGRAELIQHNFLKNSKIFESITDEKLRNEINAVTSKMIKGITEIIVQVDKATELIRGFSTKISFEMNYVESLQDINYIIKNELSFLESSLYFKHKISKQIDLQDNLPKFKAYYRDVSLAINHLLINSMKAISELPERNLRIKTYQNDANICIELTDNRKPMSTDEIRYHHLINLSTRYTAIADEARFSPYDIEIADAMRLLQLYGGSLTIVSEKETKFIIQIPKA
ncbi:PAS domain S-box protein [bacterium]|nr:PAS domain S-box protein [bacterium]